MTVIDTSDSRFSKALAIADGAASWLKIRQHGKCVAVGIRASRGDRFYVVSRTSCDCADQKRHPGQACKHRQALEIAIARQPSAPLPASVVVDGLKAMAEQRNARRYEEIFGRL